MASNPSDDVDGPKTRLYDGFSAPQHGGFGVRQVGDLAHPGELAAGVVAGAALHRLQVTGEDFVQAEGFAGGAAGPERVGTARLLLPAPGDDRVDPRVDPLVEPRPIHVEAEDPGRMPRLPRPE